MTLHSQQRIQLTTNDRDDLNVRKRNMQILQQHANNQLSHIPFSFLEQEPATLHTGTTLNGGWVPMVETFVTLSADQVIAPSTNPTDFSSGGVRMIKEHRWSSITIDTCFSFYEQTVLVGNLDFAIRLETSAGVKIAMMVESSAINELSAHQGFAMGTGEIAEVNGTQFSGDVLMIPIIKSNAGAANASSVFRMTTNDYWQLKAIEHPPVPSRKVV